MADGPGELKSVEGAAPNSVVEKVFHKRKEVHPAVKPYSPISSNGDAYLEALIHGSAAAAAAPSSVVVAPGKRSEGGEFHEHGLDPELSFRITFRRIGAGLANLGNTCFLNSVLQCLTYTEPFAAYLQSGKHKSSCHTSGFCAMCALQNHVMNALQSTGKILSPSHLVKNLRCISRNFRNARQEDAHEYMVNLLESMHRCCLPSGVPSESPSAYDKSLVHKIFGGRLRSQVKCMQCSYCSNKFDPFLDLSLEIVKADSLRKALSHFTAMEQLDGGERQYQCQRCKQQVRALKQLTIHKAPYVLTIHLKRFGSVVPGQKIDKKVEFEPALDLKPFVSDPHEVNLKYTLYGVLVHAGWSTHSGHYYCFVRTSSGMWHSLDDNQVRQVSEKTVFQQKAYMLFYVRDRDSTVKKSIDVVCKENIPTNTSGHRVHTPVSGMNRTIQNPMVDRNLSTLENTCNISKSDATCHGQSNPAVNSSSQHSLQKKAYSLQKSENDTPKQGSIVQNFSHAVLKEPSGLQLNLCILAKDVQKEVHSNSSINFSSSDNSLLKRPLVTSSVNQKVTDDLAQTAKLKQNGVATTSYTDVASLAVVNAQMNNGYNHPKGCHLDVKSGVNHAQMNNFGLLNSSSEKHSDKKFAKNSTDENCNANGSLRNINSASNVATDEIAAKLAPENTYGSSSYMNGCTQKETFSAKNVDCKDIDKENEKYSSNAQCQKGGERAVKPEEAGLADASKKSCTHNGPSNKEIHAVKGKESSVGDYHQAKVKRKKPAKLTLSRAMHFCHKQLFLTSLSMRKNKQHKKCRKHLKPRNLLKDKDNLTTNDHQASTSEAITSSVVNSKSSRKRSRSNSDQESDCRARNVKTENGDFTSFKVRVDKCRKNGVMPTTSEQPQECLSPNANPQDARETNAHSRGPDQHGFLSMLMRGLKETTVLHWDDAELPQSQNYALEDGCINNIGYVLDEWDEEYDQGKRKKVKKSRHLFGGPNPFQEAANKKAQQMMRVKAMGLTSSGNEPFRI